MLEFLNETTLFTTLVTTATLALVGFMFRQLKTIASQIQASNKASKYLLKDRITQKCRYHLNQTGTISPNDAEVLSEMMDQYHLLGGNSYISKLVEKTLDLPMSDDED